MVQPTLIDPRAHSPSHGSKIVEAFGAAVNFKRREKETSALQHPAESFESSVFGHDLRLVLRL